MSKQRVIIVDDEPNAISALSAVLHEFCPEVEIVGSTSSAKEAITLIEKERPDILFIDINMPVLSGIDVVKITEHKCTVILVTAHNDYASDAFKIGASGYILKPIDITEVIQIVRDVVMTKVSSSKPFDKDTELIRISNASAEEFVRKSDIIFLKSDGGYVEIHLKNRRILSNQGLNEMTRGLGEGFFRLHHSFTINLSKIVKFYPSQNEVLLVGDNEIPVSRRKKQEFQTLLKTKYRGF